MTLESHIPPLILGCGALAGVQKEPGSLGFARYDTRKDPKNVTLTTVGRGTGLLGVISFRAGRGTKMGSGLVLGGELLFFGGGF